MTTDITVQTDRDRVRAAFAALRRAGFFARMNFWCCQTCGWGAVPEGRTQVAFYHQQDTARAFGADGNIRAGQELMIAHAGDARRIVTALEAAGLAVTWNGSAETRIAVAHRA